MMTFVHLDWHFDFGRRSERSDEPRVLIRNPRWSYGEQLLKVRRTLGLSRDEFAGMLGVDEGTVYR